MTTMSFHKSADWKVGLRRYFEYRDLGIVEATKGKVLWCTSFVPGSLATALVAITPMILSFR